MHKTQMVWGPGRLIYVKEKVSFSFSSTFMKRVPENLLRVERFCDVLGKCLYPFWNAEFLQMAVNFENCRKKWMRADDELVSCKEVLAKVETERGALEVKLKHARNQVDVEIRRRQKAEAVYEKLVGITLLYMPTP